ncbi:hypothetical protein [Novosphingobium sp. ES2-1]|uniref:hypothetical protein n=1 Tax=Novosphingobium sp. ES2-1 TaxID=2780074 RepID=UPI0018822C9A|nr:hypothetical protein [Novosphingobium sp. ES2-1]QOV92952.1 hypothetical protein IM701_09770 [Novosphingobium sp. ES2-1]
MKPICSALLDAVQMPSEIGAAWIQAGSTLVAAALAVLGIGWQIRAQAGLSRQAIIDGESRKIKAAMYDDGLRLARQVSNSSIELSTKLRVASVSLGHELQAGGPHPAIPTPNRTLQQLSDLHAQISSDCLALVFLIEERRFVDPEIIIFRDYLVSKLYDLSSVFTQEFPSHLMYVVPTPMGEVVHRAPFSRQLWAEAIASVERALQTLSDIETVVEDFNVEMQNLLLSDVFGHKVAHRAPIDPKCQVVSIENAAAVRAALDESAWAKTCREAEEQERERQRQISALARK